MEKRIKAYFPPEAPQLAIRVFNFFLETDQNVIVAGGMEHHVIALDQYTIGELGIRDYNIELSRYLYFFKQYENKLLLKQQREKEARK